MCLCHGCDDVFGPSGWAFFQLYFDAIELVAYMFEFFVEFVAVVSEPVLQALEQVPWKVALIAFWIAVVYDRFEPLAK